MSHSNDVPAVLERRFCFVDGDGRVHSKRISADYAVYRNMDPDVVEGGGQWVDERTVKFCADCGLVGELTGHMECEFPQNHE